MDTTRNANHDASGFSVLDTVTSSALLTVGFAAACVLAIVASGAL